MQGKIDVIFTITNYGSDPKITMRALLKKKGVISKKGSIAGALLLKPYHELAKYETFQLIAVNYKKLDELDQAVMDTRGSIKLVIEAMPAEFIHAKRKTDGSEYDAVLINLGTKEAPHNRIFYLSDMQTELLSKGFKPEYEFTYQEELELEEEEETEEED